MKNILLISLIILFSNICLGQNNITKYEYWFDNDYGSTTSISVSPNSQLNVNTNVPTTGLSFGIHTFNFRAKQTNGKYSSIISQFFYKTASTNLSNTNIVAYQYWFDNDYANAISVSTPNQQQVNINQLIQTSTLTNGIHTFNIRFKADVQQWSSVVSQFFYKTAPTNLSNTNIVAYQYWFDNDYVNAINASTPNQQQVNINQLIQTSTLTSGIHTFNIRFKDNTQQWSSVASQFFYKTPSNNVTNRNLVAYQYWFDNDYANAISISTPNQQQVNLNQLIQTSTLTNGIHTFSIRFKDNSDLWSGALSQFFYKMPNQQGTNNHITAYRYWINSDFNNHVLTNLPSPVQQLNLDDVIDFSQFTKGRYAINFQFKDKRGLWSVVTTDSLLKIYCQLHNFQQIV